MVLSIDVDTLLAGSLLSLYSAVHGTAVYRLLPAATFGRFPPHTLGRPGGIVIRGAIVFVMVPVSSNPGKPCLQGVALAGFSS